MKHRFVRRFAVVTLALLCVPLIAVLAYAEIPAAQAPSTEGVAHHWVAEQAGWAPYTETTGIERVAKTQAAAALKAPPTGLVTQADKGYSEAQRRVLLAKSLKGADPVIVGHELLVFNSEKAARFYVGKGGDVKLLEVGPTQQMLVTRATAATDRDDGDAIEMGKQALEVASGLGLKGFPVEGALVTAHAVGFTDADGSHIVLRVDPDGNTSYTDW